MTTHHSSSLDDIIEAYRQHQRHARGLRDGTVHGYERLVRLFVSDNGTTPRLLAVSRRPNSQTWAIGTAFRNRPGSDAAESGPGGPRGYGQAEVL